MNPTEFQTARSTNAKAFETNYAQLKDRYSKALSSARAESDRPKQCVLIKSALDANKDLTTLVTNFLRLNDEGGRKLSPDRIHKLQGDIEKYKQQHADVQQGRDKLYSLQKSFADVDGKTIHVEGVNLFYFALICIGLLILFGLVFASGVRRALNTQPIAPIVPGRFT